MQINKILGPLVFSLSGSLPGELFVSVDADSMQVLLSFALAHGSVIFKVPLCVFVCYHASLVTCTFMYDVSLYVNCLVVTVQLRPQPRVHASILPPPPIFFFTIVHNSLDDPICNLNTNTRE